MQSVQWLAEQVGKSRVTVNRWCSNTRQPSIEMLYTVARVLGMRARDLLVEDEEVWGEVED